jgi:hypothetical protein
MHWCPILYTQNTNYFQISCMYDFVKDFEGGICFEPHTWVLNHRSTSYKKIENKVYVTEHLIKEYAESLALTFNLHTMMKNTIPQIIKSQVKRPAKAKQTYAISDELNAVEVEISEIERLVNHDMQAMFAFESNALEDVILISFFNCSKGEVSALFSQILPKALHANPKNLFSDFATIEFKIFYNKLKLQILNFLQGYIVGEQNWVSYDDCVEQMSSILAQNKHSVLNRLVLFVADDASYQYQIALNNEQELVPQIVKI